MKFLRFLIVAAYAVLIFYLSSRTWEGVPSFAFADKGYHAVLYFGLGGLVLWALRLTALRGKPYIAYVALIISMLYGLSDETHQIFVPGREYSFFDMMADTIGAALGIFVAGKMAAAKEKRKGFARQ